MNLTPHFTLHEFARTGHRALAEDNYVHAKEHYASLVAVASMLEVIREHYGSPVIVHSGYRSPRLNAAIGGSKRSQHMLGEAADFHVVGADLRDVWEWIWKESGIDFGQIILEGAVAGHPTWIHLSLGAPWRPAARCGEVYSWDAEGGYRRVA